MKAIYLKPEIQTYTLKTEHQLLAGSDVAVGEEYGEGQEVLSRQQSSWGSVWNDDDSADDE